MIEINIATLKSSPGDIKNITMEAKLSPIGEGAEEVGFVDDLVKLELTLTNLNNTLILNGQANATLILICGNCLDKFNLPMEVFLSEVYYNETREKADLGEDWIPYKGDILDITLEVKTAFLNSLPMRLVCKKDCKGLCSVCGNNLNYKACQCQKKDIDPRLMVLQNLLKK